MNGFWHTPMLNALTAGIAVWLATAAGAAWVFLHRMLGERSRGVLVGAAGTQAGPMTTGNATTMSLAIGLHNMIALSVVLP